MRPFLHDAWWRLALQDHHPTTFADALACRLLEGASAAYGGAVRLRNTAYDRGWLRAARLPCPVVSIGNVTVGGTGKTACVELVAKKLMARGARVAVLSRGYGGSRRAYWLRAQEGRLLVDGEEAGSVDGLADEPQLLARRLDGVPVVVEPRRKRAGRLACAALGCDALVLDDGFQHRQVRRDCDIVLVDGRTPPGGWSLFPRGPMREPLVALGRADAIVITKIDEAPEAVGALREHLGALNPSAAMLTAMHEPVGMVEGFTGHRQALSALRGARVALVSSIGDPAGFESTVRRLEAEVRWHQRFPDHHRYREADWAALRARASGSNVRALLTTEKDWVRLAAPAERAAAPAGRQAGPVPVWVLEVRLRIVDGEGALDDRLARLRIR